MSPSRRVTREQVFSVFRNLSDPNEALAAKEVAEVVDCSRRTAYKRLNELTDAGLLNSKKIGEQVRIWWPATDDDPGTTPIDEQFLSALTTKHVLELEFRSVEMAKPLLEHGMADIQISMEKAVTLEDETELQYWTVSNVPIDKYLEILNTRPGVMDVRLLSTVEGEHRLEIHSSSNGMLRAFKKFDGEYEKATVEDGKLKIIGEFPATVDKEPLVEAVPDSYGLELTSQHLLATPNLMRSITKENLTDRQWTTYQIAYHAGYFDRPRTSTGEELAERMDITKQTFHRHLRDAQRRVARTILEDIDADNIVDFISAK